MTENMINLLSAIDDIDNIDDYKLVMQAINNHKLYFQLATGMPVEDKPTEDEINDYILDLMYLKTGDQRVYEEPELFINPKTVDIDVSDFIGVKYFISKGFIPKANYLLNLGLNEKYGLELELIKDFGNGDIAVIRFESSRVIDNEEEVEEGDEYTTHKEFLVSAGIRNVNTRRESPRNITKEGLYYINEIINELERKYPEFINDDEQ